MKLTENFSLAELTKSQTATRLGFENKPNQNFNSNEKFRFSF